MTTGLEIHEAAATGDFDALEEYLRSGKVDINYKDEEWNNRTALHWACAKGYVECIRLLLEFGAHGNPQTDTGWTPAHFAAEAGRITSLRALHNAGIMVDRKDIYGDRPRRVAEIYGHTECVNFLEQCALEDPAERRSRSHSFRSRTNSSCSSRGSRKTLASLVLSSRWTSRPPSSGSTTSLRSSVTGSAEEEIREKSGVGSSDQRES